MREHITHWLGAYHDGELQGARLRQVEAHLAVCEECQAELDALQDLSALFKATTEDEKFLPADRFAANLALRLPRREAPANRDRPAFPGGWLVPVGLLLAWVLVDTTLSLSSAAALALDTGLFGSLPTGAAVEMSWFGAAMNLIGNQLGGAGLAILALINDANVLLARALAPLIPQALIAAGYFGWLLAWWLRPAAPVFPASPAGGGANRE